MADDLRTRLARFIGKRRQWPLMQWGHQLAAFFEAAYDNEEWDPTANGEFAVLQKLAPARFKTAFDVGAHVGDWSIAALRAWPEATVHAFEVAPPTFERLRKHIDAEGLSARALLNPVGLSDAAGVVDMYYFPDHPNLTCNQPRHHQFRATTFAGRVIDGDSYMAQQRLATIDFLKIDVEGAEHLVLNGLRQAITSARVHCVQFEYGAFSIQTHVLLADYHHMLAPHFWIGKIYPTHVDFQDYDWRMENFKFSNMLCVGRHRQDLRDMLGG